MSNLTELAITSDSAGQLWNSCVWDTQAGTSLMVYKGGDASSPHTLCFLGMDYLLSAESVKPLLHVWPLNSQEMVHQGLRTVCPGQVSALAASPDACYCVAGIKEKLHVWQISTGRLLSVAARHFQKITCVQFTDDSSHFVSGGEDGMVMVWSLANLVCSSTGDSGDPRYIFSAHSLPVQDLTVGHGGIRARLVTVSSDRACKVYDLASGSFLLSVVFGQPLTAVAMDLTERNIFVGATNGTIHQFNLCEPPRMQEYHVDSSDNGSLNFVGHTKAVTCLSVSQDGMTLLSGSNDKRVLIWHIPSRQCTRVLPHQGPITNAFFFVAPKQVFTNELQPKVILNSFQRGIDHDSENNITNVMTTENLFENEEQQHSYRTQVNTPDAKIRKERDLYKKVNHDLYKFAVNNIIKNLHMPIDPSEVGGSFGNTSHEMENEGAPRRKKVPKCKKKTKTNGLMQVSTKKLRKKNKNKKKTKSVKSQS